MATKTVVRYWADYGGPSFNAHVYDWDSSGGEAAFSLPTRHPLAVNAWHYRREAVNARITVLSTPELEWLIMAMARGDDDRTRFTLVSLHSHVRACLEPDENIPDDYLGTP